ncbi:MAG: DUF4097 family beta strand repeat-containing protein [Vicinamibacterales bacterium]
MRKPVPVVVPFAGLVAAALAFAACDITIGASEYSVREEKTFTVSGAPQLALSTFDGSIEVRGWDRGEVVVEVEKVGPDQATVERIQVTATRNGDAITIDVRKPSPFERTGMRRTPSANLVVSVPLKSAIVARSGDGSISIRRVTGPLDLDTEDGSLRVVDVAGPLVARTGDGDVIGQKMDGQAEIHTGDGVVGLDGVFTALMIETRDGAVEVTARRGSRTDGEWDVTTGDGDIRVELPEGFGAEADARTADGRIRARNLGVEAGDTGRHDHDADAARFLIGGGGKMMRLRTNSGSITIVGQAGQ